YIMSMAAVFACSALGNGGSLLKTTFGPAAANLDPAAPASPSFNIGLLLPAAAYPAATWRVSFRRA
ncbi:hypothetical protein NX875_28870, partial [Burkholderia thailandensis]|nr:hypothetical protein [Burkholderia thailandensis]